MAEEKEVEKVVIEKKKKSKLKILYYVSLMFLVVFIIKAVIFIVELARKIIHGATQGVIFYPLLIIGLGITILFLALKSNEINVSNLILEYFKSFFDK